jgi:hypothetical protein
MEYTRGKNPNSRNGFKRIYTVNHDFFENKTQLSCYYAGFIAADGNINKDQTKLTISLKRGDLVFLEQFNHHIRSTYLIKDHLSYSFPQSVLSITSRKIVRDLQNNFNIGPQKSLILKPPSLYNSKLIDYFIKGYLDGDGCVYYNEKSGLHLGFVGTKEISDWIIQRFSQIVNRELLKARKLRLKQYCSVQFSDKTARAIFLHYYNLDYGLLRKWSINYFNFCNNWITRRYKEEKYSKIYNLSKSKTNVEIARIFQCTPTNIGWIKKSNNYQLFLKENKL